MAAIIGADAGAGAGAGADAVGETDGLLLAGDDSVGICRREFDHTGLGTGFSVEVARRATGMFPNEARLSLKPRRLGGAVGALSDTDEAGDSGYTASVGTACVLSESAEDSRAGPGSVSSTSGSSVGGMATAYGGL